MIKLYYKEEKNYDLKKLLETNLLFKEVILTKEEFSKKFPNIISSPQVYKNDIYFGSSTTLDEFLDKYIYCCEYCSNEVEKQKEEKIPALNKNKE